MLAARDQENLVHGHQTVAASKPLNQGVRQLPPKTPGARAAKTPFKVSFNDENNATQIGDGKVTRKGSGGNEQAGTKARKFGEGDKNAFITPMGPRSRAPLGAKTTNVKARPFQTPGPSSREGMNKSKEKPQQQKPLHTSRKPKPQISPARTTKVELQDAQEELQMENDDDREIEYMPPRPQDLPDYPDDFPPDMEYPQLKGANLTRGWYSHYCNPVDEHGVPLSERRAEERSKQLDQKIDELSWRMIEEMPIVGYNVPEYPGDETTLSIRQKKAQAELPRRIQNPSAANPGKVRNAAPPTEAGRISTSKPSISALASKRTPATVANKTKMPGGLRGTTSVRPNPGLKSTSTVAQNAVATSRNTIGYSKGRRTAVLAAQPENHSSSTTKAGNTSRNNDGNPSQKASLEASEGSTFSIEALLSKFPQKAGVPLYSSKEEWERHQFGGSGSKSISNDPFGDEDAEHQDNPHMRGLYGTDETALQQLLQDEDEDDFQLVLKE
ncbi:MAG: hypothetical protein M4579_004810 [Chaenotheca gracillima]|nr:MAG: hypothetical protein M4579_004810 [Chaenotheca gracillima]